jgi:CRP-like cAMP-binding protein
MAEQDENNELPLYKGDILFSEKDETDFAYLIKRGKINLFRVIDGTEVIEKTLQSGDILGAVEIIQQCPRLFSARAEEFSTLVKINPNVLKVIYKDSLPIVKTMLIQMASRIQELENSIIPLKKKGKLADHFISTNSNSDSKQMNYNVMKKEFRKGEFIYQKGEDSNCAYRIKNGYVEIIREGDQDEKKVENLKAGDLFGELGVISGAVRDHTAKASGDFCELERIDRITLNNMIRDTHPVIKGIMDKIVQRIQDVERNVSEFRMFDNIFLIFTTFLFRQATENDESLQKSEPKYNIKGMSSQRHKKIDKTITLGDITKRVKDILLQLRAMHLIDIDEPEDPKYRNATKITVKDIRLFLKKAQQAYDKYLKENK